MSTPMVSCTTGTATIGSTSTSPLLSGSRKRGVEFRVGSLHDGFGGFDGFGGSGEHLTLRLLVKQSTVATLCDCWNGVFEPSAERARFLPNFRAPKFENSEPEKLQFHTPGHSVPPLDSLLPIVRITEEGGRA